MRRLNQLNSTINTSLPKLRLKKSKIDLGAAFNLDVHIITMKPHLTATSVIRSPRY